MDYLLHIDTSGDTGTVAIAGDGIVKALRTNNEARNHAGAINGMIDDALADAGIMFPDLGGIVACGGPGSYTGLRIGVATAKGLCYALDKPLLLDNKLTLLAYQAWHVQQNTFDIYLAGITAREKEYFVAVYDNQFSCILPPQHITEDQLQEIAGDRKNIHITGNAAQSICYYLKVNNLADEPVVAINSDQWAFYAFEQYKANNSVDLAAAEPFYLKQVYTHK
jgi:tRNA threonylcarbamoyladenosine biosynthesis protein TsaB